MCDEERGAAPDSAQSQAEQCADHCAPLALDAFTALVDRLQHPLHVFLHGLVGDADQAYDLMQDAWRDAWRAHQRGSPPFVAGSAEEERRRWLFQVAYHRAISVLRRRRLIRWESLDRLAGLGAEPESDASAFEDRLAERDAMRQALARLVPQDAACLLLRLVEGFSAAEVVSANDGWAVGDYGLILHYDGTAWRQVASPTQGGFAQVQMLSATDGSAVGNSLATNRLYHYDGRAWTVRPVPAIPLNDGVPHPIPSQSRSSPCSRRAMAGRWAPPRSLDWVRPPQAPIPPQARQPPASSCAMIMAPGAWPSRSPAHHRLISRSSPSP